MKHFTFGEFERSATAVKFGIDNRIPETSRKNVAALVDNVLDPLRQAWGKPLRVTSGYRCPELNKAVNGALSSQHMRGEAADITTGNAVENRKVFELAQRLGLPFDQLIDEHDYSWLHISHGPRHRRQILHL